MKQLISLHGFRPGKPEVLPIEKLTSSKLNFNNCYKIVVGYGIKERTGYKIKYTANTFYLGKIVSKADVQYTNLFGTVRDKDKATVFIKLNNGMFMEIYDYSLVLDLEKQTDFKLIDFFSKDNTLGIL